MVEELPAKAVRKLRWATMTAEERKAHVAAWRARGNAAGRDRWNQHMITLAKLGLIPGLPNRLTMVRGENGMRKETMVERARREIAWMRDLDERFEAFKESNPEAAVLDRQSNGDRFRALTDKSMDVFDKILSADLPMVEENAKLIREQREAAAVTIRIGARVAIEMYRGQSIGALQALLEKMKSVGSPAIDETPTDSPSEIIEGEVLDK